MTESILTIDHPSDSEDVGLALANLIRSTMRSTLMGNGSSKANIDFKTFNAHLSNADGVLISEIVAVALDELTLSPQEGNQHDLLKFHLMNAALRYYLERSCRDVAAKGRSSQRWRDVLDSIHEISKFHAASSE